MITIIKGHGIGKLYVNTDLDLTDITSQIIKYEKPDGTTGQFAAVIDNIAKGILAHELAESDFDQVGYWKAWAYVTKTGGEIGIGEPFIINVVNEGKTF